MWNARKQDAVNGGRSMEVTKVTGYQFCLNTNLQIRQIIKNTQKNNNLKSQQNMQSTKHC